MDRDILWERARCGEEYLRVLNISLASDWLDLYRRFVEEGRPLVRGMALVHPEHYRHRESQLSVQGPRQFAVEVAQGRAECYSERLWGFACPERIVGRVCGDHVFPYSHGGPTVAANKMLLCSTHNRMKSSDVHVFPWEAGMPIWLPEVLDKIRMIMSRKR